jgi:cell division protein YceG involved in septum cleavage
MKKNLYNIIAFFLVFSFLILCLFYYNSSSFIKNVDKKRLDYSVFLNSHVEKLDKISSSSDFKKRIDNNDFFENIYKQKQYWDLIK